MIKQSNYYTVMSQTIKRVIEQIKTNPFNEFVFVDEHPLYIEEMLLKEIPVLFSVRCINYSTFINECLLHSQIHVTKISKEESFYHLKQLLNNKDIDSIYNKKTTYATCIQLIELFEEFNEIKDLHIELSLLDDYSKQKAIACISLYREFIDTLPKQYYFNPYPLLINHTITNSSTQYIFTSPSINKTYIQEILKTINYKHITFETNDIKPNNTHQFIEEITPLQEIHTVVKHIQSLVEQNVDYNDILIYYPDQDYVELLQYVLTQYKLPYNEIIQKTNNPIHYIITTLLQAFVTNDDYILAKLAVHPFVKSPESLNSIKRDLRMQCIELNTSFIQWKAKIQDSYFKLLQSEMTLNQYNTIIKLFIEQEIIDPMKNSIVFKEDLVSLSITQYYDLLNDKLNQNENNKELVQHIKLVSLQQYQAVLLNPKYIYIIGNHEGKIPQHCPNTKLLLDNQRLSIDGLDTTIELNTMNKLNLSHVFSSFPTAIIFSCSKNKRDGSDLLASTLFKVIEQNKIQIHNKELPNYTSNLEQYYLKNNFIKNHSINSVIEKYYQTKNQPEIIQVEQSTFENLSVTQLETYRKCPYNYLLTYIIKPTIPSGIYLQSNEIGTIVHEIIETNVHLYKNKEAVNEYDNIDIYLDDIKTQIFNIIKNNKYISYKINHPYNQYLINKLAKDCIHTIKILQYQKTKNNYQVTSLEKKIHENYNDYSISGIIDRIDELDNSFITIDYKNSKKQFKPELVSSGFQIQLSTYASINAKDINKNIAGMFYFTTKKLNAKKSKNDFIHEDFETYIKQYQLSGFIHEDFISYLDSEFTKESEIVPIKYIKSKDAYKGPIFDDQIFDFQMERIIDNNNKIYTSLCAGDFKISPSQDSDDKLNIYPCTYCKHKSLCRFDVFYNNKNIINFNEESKGEEDDC